METKKTFSFNAGSFHLNAIIENYLRENMAISLDFGSSAYINSEMAAVLLGNLVNDRKLGELTIERLRAEAQSYDDKVVQLARSKSEFEEHNIQLKKDLQRLSTDLDVSQRLVKEYAVSIDSLRTEISKLRVQSSKVMDHRESQIVREQSNHPPNDRATYELKTIRIQYAEALASIKVLENENAELSAELEQLRKQTQKSTLTQTMT